MYFHCLPLRLGSKLRCQSRMRVLLLKPVRSGCLMLERLVALLLDRGYAPRP